MLPIVKSELLFEGSLDAYARLAQLAFVARMKRIAYRALEPLGSPSAAAMHESAQGNHTAMKHVGFTGTQNDLTQAQILALLQAMGDARADVLHHGDCIGADAMAHVVAKRLGVARHTHPPVNASKRAHCDDAEHTSEPREYLDRNHDIVDACASLIACPSGPETLRSGTWSTVRYARKACKPITLVWPDGRITHEG